MISREQFPIFTKTSPIQSWVPPLHLGDGACHLFRGLKQSGNGNSLSAVFWSPGAAQEARPARFAADFQTPKLWQSTSVQDRSGLQKICNEKIGSSRTFVLWYPTLRVRGCERLSETTAT